MSSDMLILLVLSLPLITAFGIYVLSSVPDLREGATLVGAASLFGAVIWLVSTMGQGPAPALVLGEAAPGLVFALSLIHI